MTDTLRITTCMYGGNSRIAFIAGVGFALVELIVASRRHHGEGDVPGFEWLPDTAGVDLPRVSLDVIAGASAGGVAGGVLGKMLFHSADPEDDFRRAAALFVDQMDVALFSRPQACPTAIFDKSPLTVGVPARPDSGPQGERPGAQRSRSSQSWTAAETNERTRGGTRASPKAAEREHRDFEGSFRAMLDVNLPTAETPALQPGGELWLALTQLSGALEYFGQPVDGQADADDLPVEDLNYLEGRRFDLVDYESMRADLADAVEATSANPFGFSPRFICDHTAIGGYIAWLKTRSQFDPNVPQMTLPDPPPPELSAYFDGGALDNRPLGMAIDAMFRRGVGTEAGDVAAVLLVDPDAQTAAQTYGGILDTADDGRREPHLTDQLAGLARGYRILRHERINPDLQRLVTWQERTRLHARMQSQTCEVAPSDAALATAADLILFAGNWQRRLTRSSEACRRLLDLAHALANRPHGHRDRQALLLAGLRVRRLIAMQDRWREMARLGRADAPARLTAVQALLDAELDAMYARADALGAASPTALHHLVQEATMGAPLPRGGRPVELALRRVGPPEGGLASSGLGGTIGFFDRDLRAHDLLVGMALGRQAVARLLPDSARGLWRSHFELDADPRRCANAVCWFETAQGGLPWADWEAARARIDARRSPDQDTLIAPSTRAYYPELLETAAHVLERLWVLSALASDRRDNALYGLNRGPLALFTRFFVPRMLRADARLVRTFKDPQPIRRFKIGLFAVPLLFFFAVGTLSATLVSTLGIEAWWLRAFAIGGLGLVIGALPVGVGWLIYGQRAKALRARCAAEGPAMTPASPAPARSTGAPPGPGRSGAPTP